MGGIWELIRAMRWEGVPLVGQVFALVAQCGVLVLQGLFTETVIMMYRRGRGQKITKWDDDTPLRLELYERFATYLGSP